MLLAIPYVGDLCYRGHLVILASSPTIHLLLTEFHKNPIGGHQGALKTYQRLAREVNWKGMKARARSFIAECEVCHQAKYLTLAPIGLLQAIPISESVGRHCYGFCGRVAQI